jgi:tRNA nucleotidyltransferase (CCA-adding enzyme)
VHDLGKADTPKEILPSHRGHEERGVVRIRALAERMRIPNRYRDLAIKVARHHGLAHRFFELRPRTVVKLFEAIDILRRPEGLEPFLRAVEADFRGRGGSFSEQPYPQADAMREAAAAIARVSSGPLVEQGLKGEALGQALRRARIDAVADLDLKRLAPGPAP